MHWDEDAGTVSIGMPGGVVELQDRKSTRLNSSHRCTSYAVFCLEKKQAQVNTNPAQYPSHLQ